MGARQVDIRKVRDCLDGTVIKEVSLPTAVGEAKMRHLASGADLDYFPHFPRPYFRIRRPRHYVLQGVLGNTTFRATLLVMDPEVEAELLRLAEFEPGDDRE